MPRLTHTRAVGVRAVGHRVRLARAVLLALLALAPPAFGGTPVEPDHLDVSIPAVREHAVIHASVHSVWNALTSREGIAALHDAAEADVDFRAGGHIRTAPAPGGRIGGPMTVTQHIIAYDPERSIVLRTTLYESAPESLRHLAGRVWTVYRLEPLAPHRTRLILNAIADPDADLTTEEIDHLEKGLRWLLSRVVSAFNDEDRARGHNERIMEQLSTLTRGEWIIEQQLADGSVYRARARWRHELGGFILGRGWIGDHRGLLPHGFLVIGPDPRTNAVAFTHFGECGDVARGHIRMLDDDRLAMDWTLYATDQLSAYYIEMRFPDEDTHVLRLFETEALAHQGADPRLELTYTRVAVAPRRFREPNPAEQD